MSVTDNLTLGQIRRSAAGRTRRGNEAEALDRVGTFAHKDKSRGNFPAVSNSGSRSRAPCPWTRSRCCSTNHLGADLR
jgi:hypothetical protein